MLDLSKQYGIFEGLSFYGDHENEKIVYYLPDEVSLSTTSENHYDMDLMIFNENNVVTDGKIDLDKAAGSILQLGVCCTVDPERFQTALDGLKNSVDLPDDVQVMQPTWNDGLVEMMILDKTKSDSDSNESKKDSNDTGFVKDIIGSQKPSLMTNDLKSIFNVRLARRGTELIFNALQGSRSSLAGIMYDLKFPALLPAADLRITANLSRCQETTSHELGVGVDIPIEVDIDLSAKLKWLTDKMVENGDIKIEVLSLVETDEDKKRIQQLVTEFQERVLSQLFMPQISSADTEPKNSAADEAVSNVLTDIAGSLSDAVKAIADSENNDDSFQPTVQNAPVDDGKSMQNNRRPNGFNGIVPGYNTDSYGTQISKIGKMPKISVSYVFNKKKIESNKVMMVDYRERSTTIKTHNPQSHLWMFGLQLGDTFKNYVTQVDFGDLWKTQIIHASVDSATFENTGLSFAEVAFWKKECGVDNTKPDNEFSIPNGTSPLVVTLDKEHPDAELSWARDNADEVGYYYQVRFGFPDQQVVSEPIVSYTGNLIVIPDLCIFNRKLHVMGCGIDYGVVRNVDVRLDISDPAGVRAPQYVLLSEANNEDSLIVRGRYREQTSIQMTRTIDFFDGSKISAEESVFGSEIPVYSPLLGRSLTVVFSGMGEDINSVIMDFVVKSNIFTGSLKKRFVFSDFTIPVAQVDISVLDENDTVSYELYAVRGNGDLVNLPGGISDGSPIAVKLADIDAPQGISIEWDGCSPEDAGLKRVEVIVTNKDKNELTYEFKGSSVPQPMQLKIAADADISVRIVKRSYSGEKEVLDNVPVQDGKIVVKCQA